MTVPIERRRVADHEDLRMMLKGTGHELQMAPDGLQALRSLQDWVPDVVLLDMFMSNTGGLESIVATRKTPARVTIISVESG